MDTPQHLKRLFRQCALPCAVLCACTCGFAWQTIAYFSKSQAITQKFLQEKAHANEQAQNLMLARNAAPSLLNIAAFEQLNGPENRIDMVRHLDGLGLRFGFQNLGYEFDKQQDVAAQANIAPSLGLKSTRLSTVVNHKNLRSGIDFLDALPHGASLPMGRLKPLACEIAFQAKENELKTQCDWEWLTSNQIEALPGPLLADALRTRSNNEPIAMNWPHQEGTLFLMPEAAQTTLTTKNTWVKGTIKGDSHIWVIQTPEVATDRLKVMSVESKTVRIQKGNAYDDVPIGQNPTEGVVRIR